MTTSQSIFYIMIIITKILQSHPLRIVSNRAVCPKNFPYFIILNFIIIVKYNQNLRFTVAGVENLKFYVKTKHFRSFNL